jgi:hypothetical protein
MKSLSGPAHGLEPTAQQLRPLLARGHHRGNGVLEGVVKGWAYWAIDRGVQHQDWRR